MHPGLSILMQAINHLDGGKDSCYKCWCKEEPTFWKKGWTKCWWRFGNEKNKLFVLTAQGVFGKFFNWREPNTLDLGWKMQIELNSHSTMFVRSAFFFWYQYMSLQCSLLFLETLCAVWSIGKNTHIKYCIHISTPTSSGYAMAAPVYAQQPVQMTQVLGEVPKQTSRSLGSEKSKNDPEQHWRRHSFVNIWIYMGHYVSLCMHHIYIMIWYHFSDIKSKFFEKSPGINLCHWPSCRWIW